MTLTLPLFIQVLTVCSLLLLIVLLVQLICAVISARKIVKRVEMITDIKQWFNIINFFKRNK